MNAAAPSTASSMIVPPESGRLESLVVGVVALVVLIGTVAFAWAQPEQGSRPQLTDWQISAFDDLGEVDQAMYSALLSATEEITFTQQEYAHWLTVEELAESFVPPFYEDAFWRRNGEVQWDLHHPVGEVETSQGATFYFGHSGKVEGQGAWLIVQRHSHAGYNAVTQAEIWLHENPDVAQPAELRQDSLIRNGWLQVVPYSGADEGQRLR